MSKRNSKPQDDYTDAMAAAFIALAADAEPGSTEPLGPAKWVPPHHPTLEGASNYSSSAYSLFDWWFASVEVKSPHAGYDGHLFEWDMLRGDWVPLTVTHGMTVNEAFKASHRYARNVLVTGQRPEAEAQSPELANLVAYWRKTGTHLLKKDEPDN